MQHKVPDEDTSEIKYDSRLLVVRRRSLAALDTSSYKWDSRETGIHGTFHNLTLKLGSPLRRVGSAFLGGSRPIGQTEYKGYGHIKHSTRWSYSFWRAYVKKKS